MNGSGVNTVSSNGSTILPSSGVMRPLARSSLPHSVPRCLESIEQLPQQPYPNNPYGFNDFHARTINTSIIPIGFDQNYHQMLGGGHHHSSMEPLNRSATI